MLLHDVMNEKKTQKKRSILDLVNRVGLILLDGICTGRIFGMDGSKMILLRKQE